MDTFHRPDLARSMAESLLGLRPGGFGNRQDLFLANLRRTGKSTFLMSDLTPALVTWARRWCMWTCGLTRPLRWENLWQVRS